ncbi:hypothetical protein [Anaeromicropila herbilytica]|uniref:Uncharacterized protein n=1 Tax=Anaeromicropila herbilytica TaxID=2785025 RepID=A0A7R7IEL2_9FIRM|nr:hypothetical protein [Anaeromicropila herbilytica]BCN32823.1 hypothetical protein bsdtb5_41180 [Anaeromicropila herbilytica]
MNKKTEENNRLCAYEYHLNLYKEARDKNMPVYFNEILASENNYNQMCLVLEDGCIMSDFISNYSGEIISVCFDSITEY